jgi:hypothetical protein
MNKEEITMKNEERKEAMQNQETEEVKETKQENREEKKHDRRGKRHDHKRRKFKFNTDGVKKVVRKGVRVLAVVGGITILGGIGAIAMYAGANKKKKATAYIPQNDYNNDVYEIEDKSEVEEEEIEDPIKALEEQMKANADEKIEVVEF